MPGPQPTPALRALAERRRAGETVTPEEVRAAQRQSKLERLRERKTTDEISDTQLVLPVGRRQIRQEIRQEKARKEDLQTRLAEAQAEVQSIRDLITNQDDIITELRAQLQKAKEDEDNPVEP
jgi:hypothetical protein